MYLGTGLALWSVSLKSGSQSGRRTCIHAQIEKCKVAIVLGTNIESLVFGLFRHSSPSSPLCSSNTHPGRSSSTHG